MSLKEIQLDVDEWTSQFDPQYWKPHEIYARLGEEFGELGREINHVYGSKPKKPTEDKREMGEEIADIIFTLCCLANSQGINLDDSWKTVIDKCYGRDNQRYKRR